MTMRWTSDAVTHLLHAFTETPNLQLLAPHFGVSRERLRQVLARAGVDTDTIRARYREAQRRLAHEEYQQARVARETMVAQAQWQHWKTKRREQVARLAPYRGATLSGAQITQILGTSLSYVQESWALRRTVGQPGRLPLAMQRLARATGIVLLDGRTRRARMTCITYGRYPSPQESYASLHHR